MSDTSRRELINIVRSWLKASTGFGDGNVIRADLPGPRPTPPYFDVRMLVPNNQLGTDAEIVTDDDPPVHYVEGAREDTVSVRGWGRGCTDLLRQAVLDLRKPSIRRLILGLGATIHTVDAPINPSTFLDSDIEERVNQSFWLRYRLTSAIGEEQAEPAEIAVDACLPDSNPFTLP